ncbi:MAG: SpoIIE family protein phosphatase [Candidatus Angelobacter sp.]
MFRCVVIPLADASSAGAARRAGMNLGASLGLGEVKNGELGIIITEAARNAILHGKGGQLVVAGETSNDSVSVDILALDGGPGIKDIARAFEDGYSTAGTPGTGLGAIRRKADAMDLFSNGGGTAVLARVVQRAGTTPTTTPGNLEVGLVVGPYPGETVSGDAVATRQDPQRTAILAVDGLGHGPFAAEAADEAVKIFYQHALKEPGEILDRIHDALKKTRGAAVAVAEIRPSAATLTYAGVGNIAATLLSGTQSRSLISHNGIVGHHMHRIQEFKVNWPDSGMLIMHSDGLQHRWDLSNYPGLSMRKAALIAGVLFRDFRRGKDDASVVVVKERT